MRGGPGVQSQSSIWTPRCLPIPAALSPVGTGPVAQGPPTDSYQEEKWKCRKGGSGPTYLTVFLSSLVSLLPTVTCSLRDRPSSFRPIKPSFHPHTHAPHGPASQAGSPSDLQLFLSAGKCVLDVVPGMLDGREWIRERRSLS